MTKFYSNKSEVNYECGCIAEQQNDGTWAITCFCKDHDPTIDDEEDDAKEHI